MRSIEERKLLGEKMKSLAEEILLEGPVQATWIRRINNFDIHGGLARLEEGLRGSKMLCLGEFAELLKQIGTRLADPM